MRWLAPLLLLTGCMPYANGPYTNVDTASLEQSRYLGKGALAPRGSPARITEAQNCGTPDRWKTCPRAPRPSVRVYLEVASGARSDSVATQPSGMPTEVPEGR